MFWDFSSFWTRGFSCTTQNTETVFGLYETDENKNNTNWRGPKIAVGTTVESKVEQEQQQGQARVRGGGGGGGGGGEEEEEEEAVGSERLHIATHLAIPEPIASGSGAWTHELYSHNPGRTHTTLVSERGSNIGFSRVGCRYNWNLGSLFGKKKIRRKCLSQSN